MAAIRTLWAMHTFLDVDTHMNMLIRICMGGTMKLESVVISGSTPGGSTFASILRVNSSHSGRSSGSGGSTGSMEEGQDRGKRGKSVMNPIPIIGGKL